MDPLAVQNTAALWALAVGFFSPLAIAALIQTHWSARTKSLSAFIFYVAVAAVDAAVAGEFTPGNIVHFALLVFVMASVSYRALWHPTGVAPAIEAATGSAPPAPFESAAAVAAATATATAIEPAAPAATPVPEAPVAEVAAAQEPAPAVVEAPAPEAAPAPVLDAPPVITTEPVSTPVAEPATAAADAPEVVNQPVS